MLSEQPLPDRDDLYLPSILDLMNPLFVISDNDHKVQMMNFVQRDQGIEYSKTFPSLFEKKAKRKVHTFDSAV